MSLSQFLIPRSIATSPLSKEFAGLPRRTDGTLTECLPNSYIPVIYCLNKIDAISIEELDLLYRIPNSVPISSEHGWNIDELMELMWEKLALKRVYTKPKGKAPDYSSPVVLRQNRSTVEDFVSTVITKTSLPLCTNCDP